MRTRGYDPQLRTRPRFLYNAPTPSFIILCLLVQKLSCWQKHTNKQTPLKTSNALRYATTLGKHSSSSTKNRACATFPQPNGYAMVPVTCSAIIFIHKIMRAHNHINTLSLATFIVHCTLDYGNSLYCNLPSCQLKLKRLHHIHISLARAAVKDIIFSHASPPFYLF